MPDRIVRHPVIQAVAGNIYITTAAGYYTHDHLGKKTFVASDMSYDRTVSYTVYTSAVGSGQNAAVFALHSAQHLGHFHSLLRTYASHRSAIFQKIYAVCRCCQYGSVRKFQAEAVSAADQSVLLFADRYDISLRIRPHQPFLGIGG